MPANVDVYMGRLPAWHNLGTVIGEYFNIERIMADGGLNFDVEKRQLEYQMNPVDAWGIFRTDNNAFLGTVGAEYTPIQHTEGFQFLDLLVGEVNGAHYETAGSLGKGETIWGLVDLGIKSGIANTQDESNNYLLFRTGHIGNFTFSFHGTRTRVVCQNTLMLALAENRSTFTIRHTTNYRDRIEQAKMLIQNFNSTVNTIDEKMAFLAGRVIEKDNMINILDELFPADAEGNRSTRSRNNIERILNLYQSNDGDAIPQIRGTAYNLLNACTEYTDHFRSVKGNTAISRAESAMFGSGNDFKLRAMDIIMAEAEKMKSIWTPTVTTVALGA
jgi:phage/plasmid-like protein (TIGR03299 family)